VFGNEDACAGASEDGPLFDHMEEAGVAFRERGAGVDRHGAGRRRGWDEGAAGPLKEVGVAHAMEGTVRPERRLRFARGR
jgi:hypothetical protein